MHPQLQSTAVEPVLGSAPGLTIVRRLHACHSILVSNVTSCRAGQGPKVLVRGQPIEVDLALTQEGVRALAADRPHRGASGAAATAGSADKRNLYLVRRGLSLQRCCPFVHSAERPTCCARAEHSPVLAPAALSAGWRLPGGMPVVDYQ